MSTPQVTLDTLIAEARITANQTHAALTKDEMSDFFQKAAEAKVPSADIRKGKARIMACWVDSTWSEAKRRNPNWREKDWWKLRVTLVERAFAECYKEHFANAPKEKKVVDDKEMFAHMPSFTNVEDILEWKAKRAANGNG